jgi:hypothetical protein
MNNKSKFTKSEWANGQPSVEIAPYDFSAKGFQRMIDAIVGFYSVEVPPVVSGVDRYMTKISIKDETVDVDMDAITCSLAFKTEALRDEVLLLLKKSI